MNNGPEQTYSMTPCIDHLLYLPFLVRTISNESPLAYIATLSCDEIPRLTCATSDPTSEESIFITGGSMLLLWKPAQGNKKPRQFKKKTLCSV